MTDLYRESCLGVLSAGTIQPAETLAVLRGKGRFPE